MKRNISLLVTALLIFCMLSSILNLEPGKLISFCSAIPSPPETTGSPSDAENQIAYIVVHALNPEGVEIASISLMNPNCVEIYDGETLIGHGAYNKATHNIPIAISAGTHTIKTRFNGITLEQNVNLAAEETKVLTFNFPRTEFDIGAFLDSVGEKDFSRSGLSHGGLGRQGAPDGLVVPPYVTPYTDLNYVWSTFNCTITYNVGCNFAVNRAGITTTKYGNASIKNIFSSDASFTLGLSWTGGGWNGESAKLHVDAPELNTPTFDKWFVQKNPFKGNYSVAKIMVNYIDLTNNESPLREVVYTLPPQPTEVQIYGTYPPQYWGESCAGPGFIPQITSQAGVSSFTFDGVKITSVPYDLKGTALKEPPVASFTFAPEYPSAFTNVTFNASSSYSPRGATLNYTWTLGDGNSKEGQVFNYSYSAPGNYVVNLTVIDSYGLSSYFQNNLTVSKVPVLLVYGWHGSEANWNYFRPWLKADGYQVEILNKTDHYDDSQSAEYNAFYLSQKINNMRDPNGDGIIENDKVDIIAHSFGGLVARYYIERLGGAKYVKDLIMIATPNNGSRLADYITGELNDVYGQNIVQIGLKFYTMYLRETFQGDTTWASSLELRTINNAFLHGDLLNRIVGLNQDFDSSKISTKYFTLAGTGHFSEILNATSHKMFLEGPDDGVVAVSSVALPGIPLYSVDLTHCSIVRPSNTSGPEAALLFYTYKTLIIPILEGNPPSTSLFPTPGSDAADNQPFWNLASWFSVWINMGESKTGSFDVSSRGELRFGFRHEFSDFEFSLTSPSGEIITPQTAQTYLGVNFTQEEYCWSFTVDDAEVGTWQYNITALDVPDGGEELGIFTLGMPAVVPDGSVLGLYGATGWYWQSNTVVNSVAVGDIDGDGQKEVVTAGCFNDGTRNVAQLIIWNSSSLIAEKITCWYWTGNTTINSVAIGDVDGDGQLEIVTGGSFFDGNRNVSQLIVWSGSNLVAEKIQCWYWTNNTIINSVSLGDVDGDGQTEIVTGGYFNDGARNVAQLIVWSGSTLVVEGIQCWYWTGNTVINSVALCDIDGDGQVEIVTGGSFFDGSRNVAQMIAWTGSTLAVDKIQCWFWTGNTVINSVAVGDVDGDGQVEVVTGGYYNDDTRDVAQLIVWSGSNLAVERIQCWYWTGNTVVNSVAIGDVDGYGQAEIVTGGRFNDGSRDVAQLIVWSGLNSAVKNIQAWYWTSNTIINSVTVDNINGDFPSEIITGGAFNDGARLNSQLTVWGMT